MKYLIRKKAQDRLILLYELKNSLIFSDLSYTFALKMPKYRLLNKTELQELEKEFIEYLILNGIMADDWERTKSEDPGKQDKIIELFSDVVFESILRKINFLEYREPNSIQIFQCLPEKIVVVSMESSDPQADFTDPGFIKKASIAPPESLKLFTTDKPYKRDREAELFEMLQTGCVVTDDKLFKTLCLLLVK
jgi:hypothetical protein